MDSLTLTWVTDIFFIFTLHILYIKILGVKYSNKLAIIFGWSLCFIAWNVSSVVFAESTVLKTISGIAVNYIILFIFYKGNFRQKILTLFTVTVLGIIAELLVAFILKFIGIDIINVELTNNNFYYIGNAFSKIIWFIFVKILAVISKNKKQTKIGIEEWCEIFLVPTGTMLILGNMVFSKEYNIILSDILMVSVLFTINITTYFIYQRVQENARNTMEQELLKQQNEYYKVRYEDTEQQWLQLRKIKHDMSNNYVLEYSYLENGQYELLKEHYLEAIGQLKNQSGIINTGNIGIDSIVNYKLEIAKENEIEMNHAVKIGGDITVSNADLNILIGNLFDNAIEAVRTLAKDERRINFAVSADKTALYFEIGNPYEGERKRIAEAIYATGKLDKVNHGLGMKAVREIVKRHRGEIKITGENQYFIVKIMIYM